ncbi:MAG TPA: hypothetical protein VF668_09355 [Pyrinomonadaceae bacterium]|jgi:hypothetical protein
MLCPNCGTRTTNEHKFCRSCGMNLEPVSRALAAHLSHGGAGAADAAREAERRVARRMRAGLLASAVVIVFGVLLLAVMPGKAFRLLGVVTALVGVASAMACVLSTMRAAAEAGVELAPPASPAPPAADAAEEAATTARLLRAQSVEPAHSVAERTTDLLGVEVEERRPRD